MMNAAAGIFLAAQRKPALPYDAELEYLESTGTQYIDLGLNSTTDSFCDFEIRFQKTISNTIPPFGYQYGAIARYGMWLGYVGIDNSHYVAFSLYGDTDWHTVKVENGVAATIDGEVTPIGAGTVRPNIGLVAFGYVTSGSLATSYTLAATRISMLKIYNMDGDLIRDYIPVRKDGVGYMYDKVSGRLFGNAGTGDFVLGSDKTA